LLFFPPSNTVTSPRRNVWSRFRKGKKERKEGEGVRGAKRSLQNLNHRKGGGEGRGVRDRMQPLAFFALCSAKEKGGGEERGRED